MKKIESATQEDKPNLTQDIQSFWTRNVNAEQIMGRTVSGAERGEQQYFDDLEQQRYRSHYHLLPWINDMQEGRTVLEIGCGIGLDSFTIAKKGLHLTAMDLTHVGVKTAQNRFLNQGVDGEFLVGNACELPFPDDHFDYVYSFGVLHHTADTKTSIEEVYRVLKPGGEAKIMLYNRHSLNEIVHRLTRIPFEDRDEVCPVVRRFTKNEVKQLFYQFNSIELKLEYLFGEGYGSLFHLIPRPLYLALSHTIGWHIMITAKK